MWSLAQNKSIRIFSALLILSLIVLCKNIVQADPLLKVNQPLWNEKAKIVMANCPPPIAVIAQTEYLMPAFEDKTFVVLDMVITNEGNRHYIYVISSEKNATVSTLYRIEMGGSLAKLAPEHSIYRLPFGAVSAKLTYAVMNQGNRMTLETSGSGKQESQYLLITANESEHSAKLKSQARSKKPEEKIDLDSFATVFEINKKDQTLTLLSSVEGMQGTLRELTTPKLIQLPNDLKVVVLAGSDKIDRSPPVGAIRMIFLGSLKSPVVFRTNAKHRVSQILAIDQHQQHIADILYAWDKGGGMWKIDLEKISFSSIQKISEEHIFPLEQDHAIIALKSMEQPGITFYFIGDTGCKSNEKTNLYRLKLPLEGKPSLEPMICDTFTKKEDSAATSCKFAAIFVRFGRLILVPEPLNDKLMASYPVLELALKGEKSITIPWKILEQSKMTAVTKPFTEAGSLLAKNTVLGNEKILSPLTQISLLWDAEQQQEVLVSLNQNCNLKCLAAPVTQDKYRRMSWQKIRN